MIISNILDRGVVPKNLPKFVPR